MAYGESNGHTIDNVTRCWRCARLEEVAPCERSFYLGLLLFVHAVLNRPTLWRDAQPCVKARYCHQSCAI